MKIGKNFESEVVNNRVNNYNNFDTFENSDLDSLEFCSYGVKWGFNFLLLKILFIH